MHRGNGNEGVESLNIPAPLYRRASAPRDSDGIREQDREGSERAEPRKSEVGSPDGVSPPSAYISPMPREELKEIRGQCWNTSSTNHIAMYTVPGGKGVGDCLYHIFPF